MAIYIVGALYSLAVRPRGESVPLV
jgi:hypothetical protein